jgi:hypothetical protein
VLLDVQKLTEPWHCVSFANDFLVLRHYDSLDHFSRFSIGRISKLPVGPVPLFLGRHGDEKSRGALNDSDFSDHQTVVENNVHVGSN